MRSHRLIVLMTAAAILGLPVSAYSQGVPVCSMPVSMCPMTNCSMMGGPSAMSCCASTKDRGSLPDSLPASEKERTLHSDSGILPGGGDQVPSAWAPDHDLSEQQNDQPRKTRALLESLSELRL